MGRCLMQGVEFIFDGCNEKEFKNLTNVVYELSNSYLYEYVGQATKGESGTYTLGKRLSGHARKIACHSQEDVYKNGLGKTKRIYVKILKQCNSPEETRLCEHETIINRRLQIANAKGYNLSRENAKKNSNSYIWSDILLNVLT